MKKFKFELGEQVSIICSGEIGEVIGRADYKNANNDYRIRYKSAEGRAVESWWSEDAILLSEDDLVPS